MNGWAIFAAAMVVVAFLPWALLGLAKAAAATPPAAAEREDVER